MECGEADKKRISENLVSVRRAIAEAAARSGRNPEAIVLVGVSKTFAPERIKEALDSGLADIGENRIQEAERKFPLFPDARKHFIGHLQGSKARKAVALCDMVQSVDSLKLAEKISGAALETGKRMPVLVEVLTDDKKHFGIRACELENFLKCASRFEGIKIQGLMTIGPLFDNPEKARPVFRGMKKLFDSLAAKEIPHVEMRYLSMGMSGDFAAAIEEGANMVRVGTAIFGERKAWNNKIL